LLPEPCKFLTILAGVVIDITDYSMEDMQRFFQQAIANKQKEEQRKQALETLMNSEAWQLVKSTMLTRQCDIGLFFKRAQEQLELKVVEIDDEDDKHLQQVFDLEDDIKEEDEEVLKGPQMKCTIAALLN
jgi:hypothetical protein